MNSSEPEYSVVVPVYQSEKTLRSLVRQLARPSVFKGEASFEIIFVDDGSRDDSWDVLKDLQSEYQATISTIRLMRNFGQHNAIMCGFREAQGKVVITMDDDLQNPPADIAKLIDLISLGDYDLVYGVPERKQHSLGRNIGSWVVNIFFRLVFRVDVRVTSFRAIRRELVDSILAYNLNFTYIDGLLAWNTQRIGQVTVDHRPRTSGKSGYSFAKLLGLALNLFTNFSLLPLQIASCAGLAASVSGLLAGVYFLVQALLSQISVPGYASIIVAVMVLGGVQLLALGVIGEYVGRLHMNVNRKPQYTVRQIVSRRTQSESSHCTHVDYVFGRRDDGSVSN